MCRPPVWFVNHRAPVAAAAAAAAGVSPLSVQVGPFVVV